MQRDLIGYAEHPPRFEWPTGARLAVNFVINYEEGAERTALDGDKELDSVNETTWPVGPDGRNRMQESVYEYGSRVAIWRLLSVLDEYRAAATVFGCALALERNPNVARAFSDRHYDIVGHGYRWTWPAGLTEEEEREQVRRAISSFQRTTGQLIRGWFTRPPQTIATRRILAEEGLLFDSTSFSDDVPYFEELDGRPFLIIPYSIDVNDIRFWRTGFFTANHFAQYCIDTFDALYRESSKTPRMMSVGIHARIIGRPGRIVGLERFLDHIRKFDDVWIAKRTDIATFWAGRFGPPGMWNWPVPQLPESEAMARS